MSNNLISSMIPEYPIAYTSPSFTYTNGQLTKITYANGATKTLSYTTGASGTQLTSVVFVHGSRTTTKTISYNADGSISSITET